MHLAVGRALLGDPLQYRTADLPAGVPQRFGQQRRELPGDLGRPGQHLRLRHGLIDQAKARSLGGAVGPPEAGEFAQPRVPAAKRKISSAVTGNGTPTSNSVTPMRPWPSFITR